MKVIVVTYEENYAVLRSHPTCPHQKTGLSIADKLKMEHPSVEDFTDEELEYLNRMHSVASTLIGAGSEWSSLSNEQSGNVASDPWFVQLNRCEEKIGMILRMARATGRHHLFTAGTA